MSYFSTALSFSENFDRWWWPMTNLPDHENCQRIRGGRIRLWALYRIAGGIDNVSLGHVRYIPALFGCLLSCRRGVYCPCFSHAVAADGHITLQRPQCIVHLILYRYPGWDLPDIKWDGTQSSPHLGLAMLAEIRRASCHILSFISCHLSRVPNGRCLACSL